MKKRTTPLLILDLGILDFRFLLSGANALTTLSGTPLYRGQLITKRFLPLCKGELEGVVFSF